MSKKFICLSDILTEGKNHAGENIMINVDVTPELASEILANSDSQFEKSLNIKQRKIKSTAIKLYAKDMMNGEWKTNGETLKLSTEGMVCDGNNRLHAVIRSGKTIPMLFVLNVLPETMPTMDIGTLRSLEDALTMSAKCFEHGVAAIVKSKMALDAKQKGQGQCDRNKGISRTEQIDEYEKYESAYNEAAVFADYIYKASNGVLKKSEVGAMYMHLIYTLNWGKDVVEAFFNSLCSKISGVKTNIYKTTFQRLKTIEKSGTKKASQRYEQYINCFNSMVNNKSIYRSLVSEDWFIPCNMCI